MTELVKRYGPNGVFTKQAGTRPIRAWQVWNEPNFKSYWFNKPNAKQYAAFVKLTRTAIKKGDKKAKIVLAGLPESRSGVPVAKYLTAFYKVRGIKSQFDVAALHPYAKDEKGVEGGLKRVRGIMNKAGDKRTPIWLTEVGYGSAGEKSPFTKTVSGQARLLTKTLKLVAARRSKYRIGMVVWFSLRDRAKLAGERNLWALHTGLFTLKGAPKPAWKAFTRFTRGSAGSGSLTGSPTAGGGGTTGPPGSGGSTQPASAPTSNPPPSNCGAICLPTG